MLNAESYIEYAQPGIQPKQLARLRRGELRYQAKIDLHQLTVSEAEKTLFNFIARAFYQNQRILLVIHGKGLNSIEPYPILKNEVNTWLRQASQVLAFCSAQPKDGGRGAVYTLLKAKRGQHRQ